MQIKIKNLSEGSHNYNLIEPVESLGIDEPFFDTIKINLGLQKLHNQLVLDTELNLNAHFICDRCNEEFNTQLKSNYKIVYLFGQNPIHENDALNVVYLPLDASEITLDKEIRDYALLAIPMKKLCIEDCKGLCTECGKNLNVGSCDCIKHETDNRWLPLQELKNKIDSN